MAKRYRMPGRVNVPIKFFGHFTVKDLLRLGIPPGAASFFVDLAPLTPRSIAVLVVAAVVSVLWYVGRPYNQYLDSLFYNAMRWLPAHRSISGSDVDRFEPGYVFASDGAAVAMLEIEPTNLEMKSEPEQGALHSLYQDLFRAVSFPLYVYSRQQPLDLSNYLEYVEGQVMEHGKLQREYIEYLESLSNGELTATRHFVAVRVEKGGKHWLYDHLPSAVASRLPIDAGEEEWEKAAQIDALQKRCRQVRRAIDSSDLGVTGVAGEGLHELIEEFDSSSPNPGATWTTRSTGDSGEFRRSAYIYEFGTDERLGWPLQLLRVDGQVDVTQVIKPRNSGKIATKLQRLKEKLAAEVATFLAQGRLGTHRLEGLEDDIDWMLDLLADRKDVMVDYSAVITAHNEDRERCKRTFADLCERFEQMQIKYRQPVFRTDHAYREASPFHGVGLDESLLMPRGSAATGFPFATQDTAETGIVYGVDTDDESPVLLDRFSWDAGHIVRVGRTGSGKSYAEKIELLRTVLTAPDVNIYVVDPKNEREYAPLVDQLGGSIQILDPDADYRFDNQYLCFDVGEQRQPDIAAAMANAVEQIYEATTRSETPTLVVIDEAHNLTETGADDGLRLLARFIREARSTNTAVTLLSQSASDFTHHRLGKVILGNTPAKVFMRHERDDVDNTVVDYFNLSQREKQALFGLKTGDAGYSEALMKVSGRVDTRVRVEATSEEHRIIEELDAEDVTRPLVEAGG